MFCKLNAAEKSVLYNMAKVENVEEKKKKVQHEWGKRVHFFLLAFLSLFFKFSKKFWCSIQYEQIYTTLTVLLLTIIIVGATLEYKAPLYRR